MVAGDECTDELSSVRGPLSAALIPDSDSGDASEGGEDEIPKIRSGRIRPKNSCKNWLLMSKNYFYPLGRQRGRTGVAVKTGYFEKCLEHSVSDVSPSLIESSFVHRLLQ